MPEYGTPKLQFYYSSLPGRKTSNPTGYSSALSWWRKTLADLTAKGLVGPDKLVLVVDAELRENLRIDKVGRPSSLGVIVVSSQRPSLTGATCSNDSRDARVNSQRRKTSFPSTRFSLRQLPIASPSCPCSHARSGGASQKSPEPQSLARRQTRRNGTSERAHGSFPIS